MDGRRHSIDLPISRALIALSRVRSLRDPSTNSTSQLFDVVDNLNLEMKSSGAIISGFDNDCSGGGNDSYVTRFKSSSLVMANDEQTLWERELNCRNSSSDAEGEESRSNFKEIGFDVWQMNTILDNEDSLARLERRIKQTDKGFHGKSKFDRWNRKHNRLPRVRAGDVLSPCLSLSDTSRECLSSCMPFHGSADVDLIESDIGGSRMRSCWSRTTNSTRPIPRTDLEERPLLIGDACQQNWEGIAPCLETPRSLSQKFMPKSFKDLVGQNVLAKSLQSAISNERIASLYLFHGPRGTGKSSAARVFAAALNCLSPDTEKPCGLCRDCVLFFSGRNNDVREVDSLRFRSHLKNIDVPPIFSKFKVYIVDECHLLRGETWSALLDKLEELPPHIVLILVTTDPDKLPCSVVSKTQRYNFQMVKVVDIASRLRMICKEEGVEIDEDALNFIATKSSGSVRDAETMLDQLSLLAKKITMSLVFEVNGVVSDAELLELLYLALSSDASNTIKKARELIGSRIDPLQLVSQLAGLIMDILAGKYEGASEIRSKPFGCPKSDAELEQLRHALKILSETEKQLRTSRNQTTWLTVALLQLSSHDQDAPILSTNVLHPLEGDSHRMSTDNCWKHSVTDSCRNVIQDKIETLELIWKRAATICESSSVKRFIRKRGKLVSLHIVQGVAVVDLQFDHHDHVSKAEKSWKVIAGVLQRILGYNVELRINLANKAKKPSLNLFGCSHRMHLRSHFCTEFGSSASKYSSYNPTPFRTSDKYVQTCSPDCGSQILHTCCHCNEKISSIRNGDGNALSVGNTTPRNSLCVDDSLTNGIADGISSSIEIKTENRVRRREHWKLCCWRSVIFPFRKVNHSSLKSYIS